MISATTPSGAPSPDETVFAAVPYVQVRAPFVLGPWRLWTNTSQDWLRETGHDYTEFMKMYRGREGYRKKGLEPEPVGCRGSVLTCKGTESPSREEFHRAIHAFSTLAWLDRMPSADPWLLEVWRLPADYNQRGKREFYPRVSKFHHNLTSDDVDRVYASPYTFPCTLRSDLPEDLLAFVVGELLKPNEESLLRSLGQFHAARFDSPYFSSFGNDLEALWSGFEAWFLPQKTSSKDASLAAAVWKELSAVPGIDPRLESAVVTFVERLYAARNGHTHGALEPSPEDSVAFERSLLGLGLELASTLLKMRAFRANDFFLGDLTAKTFEAFFRLPRTHECLTVLKRVKNPEQWYASVVAAKEAPVALAELAIVLLDVLSFENVEGLRGNKDARDACATMGRVLSCWIRDLSATPPAGFDAIAGLPEEAQKTLERLKSEGKDRTAITEALNDARVDVLVSNGGWGVGGSLDPTNAVKLGGQISLRDWIRGCLRMHELFVGYEISEHVVSTAIALPTA